MTNLVVEAVQVFGTDVRLPAECRITGVVVDERGAPVTDAWIGALDARGLPLAGDGWDTRTDATGSFQIENVPPGTCTVRAHSGEKDARSPPIEVEAGKTASTRVEIR